MSSTLQALRDRSHKSTELVAAGELVELRFPTGQKTLSARASKLFHLLVHSAADRAGRDEMHRVPIAWLRSTGLKNMTVEEFVECVRELASVTVDVEVRGEDEADRGVRQPHVKTGAFLSHIERDLDAERGELLFEFSRTMRFILRRSAYWAVLDRQATLAFESRYAIRLYELMSLRSGLERREAETFEINELRARLGVPEGRLMRWVHLRQKALEPAVGEVNHISPLHVSWTPVKEGRAVRGVRFEWAMKSTAERARARRELLNSRAGRRARRDGTVEIAPVPVSFPAEGPIRYTRWADIVRDRAPKPTPDVDMVAGQFRRFARERNIPLDARTIESVFGHYCAKVRVR